MAESEEELKSLLMKVKEESEKVGLKINICFNWKNKKNKKQTNKQTKKKTLNFQKTKIMASGPITLWEIDGETVDTVSEAKAERIQHHRTSSSTNAKGSSLYRKHRKCV